MGGTAWSDSHYTERAKAMAAAGTPAFTYDADVKSGKAPAAVHDKLNPKGVTREARDSETHPETVPIAVLFDVTGSMGAVPRALQAKLPKLYGLLIRRGVLEHPAIMVGAIGDATCDRAPLQIGQFEGGNEIEDDLSRLFLEAGGGGQLQESYELALYFMAHHTVTDAWEKRQKRGYLFVIGDECARDFINRLEVQDVIGDSLEANPTLAAVLSAVQERWDTYFIMPHGGSYWADSAGVFPAWRTLLGQQALRLEDPELICEFLASVIAAAEGIAPADLEQNLVAEGTPQPVAASLCRALTPLAAAATPRGPVATVPDSGAPSGLATL